MIQACAPGKLVVLGEYAVVHGAPAIVAAIDRFAYATLEPAPDWQLIAPEVSASTIRFSIDNDQFNWQTDEPQRLGLVEAILATALTEGLLDPDQTMRLQLSTSSFFHDAEKLGLGSSAALSVAIARVLCDQNGAPERASQLATQAHWRFQRGRGSGVDIAAATNGGLLSYRKEPRSIQSINWPPALGWRCYWTGHGASTRALLAAVEQLRARDSELWQERIDQLHQLAERGVTLFERACLGPLLELIDQYCEAMRLLGVAAGVHIVDVAHRRLSNCARQLELAYKPSGAGGGDIGMAFGPEEGLREMDELAKNQGFTPISLALTETSNKTQKTLK